MTRAWSRIIWPVCLAGLLASIGCVTVPHGCTREDVAERLSTRTDRSLTTPPPTGKVFLPNDVDLAKGLTEEEAVLIALWNNAAFQELLVDLNLTQADLVQAGILPNPEFLYYSAAARKPYRYLADFPIEALWLRPIRIAAVLRESARACDRLTQAGLDLIRDVRQAYADALLAEGRLQVAKAALALRRQIAQLALARFKAGDIGEQESETARIDALQAEQDVARIQFDTSLAQERLRNLLATGTDRAPLVLTPMPLPIHKDLDAQALADEAMNTRPDAISASDFTAAAAERLRLAKLSWFRLLGIADGTTGRKTGHEFGPAVRLTIPIFNRGEGIIARAEAELEQAHRRQLTVRNQIILDVHQAHQRYRQALAELTILDEKVLPKVDSVIKLAERSYREGSTGYVVVLQTTRQFIDAQTRRAMLHADLRRAWADLERSVGRHLDKHPPCPKALTAPEDSPEVEVLPAPEDSPAKGKQP